MSVVNEPKSGQWKLNVSNAPSEDSERDDNMLNPTTKKKKARFQPVRKLWLLFQKNFTLRRRQYVVTIFEIILPTVFCGMLAFFKIFLPNQTTTTEGITTVFKEFDERELVREFGRWKCNGPCLFAYAPDNENTQLILKQLDEGIAKYKPRTKYAMRGFADEAEIEQYNKELSLKYTSRENYTDSGEGTLRAAIIFENGFGTDEFNKEDSLKLSYKIRIVDKKFKTHEIWPYALPQGPDGRVGNKGYQEGGFALLQIFLDKILTGILTNSTLDYSLSVQAFPYPPYNTEFDFGKIVLWMLTPVLVLGFTFLKISIMRNVISEKESGIKELMKMMGLPSWLHWMGWLIDTAALMIIPITVIIILFCSELNEQSGAFLVKSDPSLWWAVLFIYILASANFAFFVSTFFRRTTVGIAVGLIFYLLSYFGTAIPLEIHANLNPSTKLLTSLIPNVALHWAIKILYSLETKGPGAKWSNINTPLNSLDGVTLLHIIFMFLADIVLYFLLTLYFESVLPSEFGIRKHPLFIFKKSFWFGPDTSNGGGSDSNGKLKSNGVELPVMSAGKRRYTLRNPFEIEPVHLKAGVKIQNISKRFGKKTAVDNLSLNLYDGQITVLLGANGAGKTTLISMLTGMFSPSGGTAKINGKDIRKEMDSIRSELGYCSQFNILFDKLTTLENLTFFGRLKGLTTKAAEKEAGELLQKLQLEDKRNAWSMSLSGGQKRKLSLGIALIGGSKVVVLDEPSAGMDPEVRRATWDLLLEMRGHRIMLLTTHFLEEASILGDRVAIMSGGSIKCAGTPIYLKRHYATGYTLKMSTTHNKITEPVEILEIVQQHFPGAVWKESGSATFSSGELSVILPKEDDASERIPKLFADLAKNKETLGILNVGLPLTTLDDVFEKVVEGTGAAESSRKMSCASLRPDIVASNLKIHKKITGVNLIWQQFIGLLTKRMIYTKRRWSLLITQMLIPVLMVIATIALTNSSTSPGTQSPPLKMSINSYRNPTTLYTTTSETENLGDFYASIVGPSALKVENSSLDILEALVELGQADEPAYRELYVIAADLTNLRKLKALFSTIPHHASPQSINLVSNTLLKYLAPEKDFSIEVTNYPLPSGLASILDACTLNPDAGHSLPLVFAMIIPIGLACMSASFIVFPCEERLNRVKQLQMMTGVSSFIFWIASFLWDYFMILIVAVMMVCCFPIFQTFEAFTSFNAAESFFLIIIVYGVSTISLSYLLSLFVETVPGGFALITIIHIITGCILSMIVHFLEQSNVFSAANVARWIGRPFPTFSASMSLLRFSDYIIKNMKCNLLTDEARNIVCNPNITDFDPRINVEEFQSCCDNCDDFEDKGVSCFEHQDFIVWEASGVSDWIDADVILPGISQELLSMLIMAFVYQLLIFIFEASVFQKVLRLLHKTSSSNFKNECVDDDVLAENKRVKELVQSGRVNEEAMVANVVCKSFGNFSAVSNVSFGVHPGECFGLLGVNGTGKTTLFRMLTGNETRSNGTAYLGDFTLDKNRVEYLRNIGYCPQFDGIIGLLTGKEMLELFCRLRGIPPQYVSDEANKWLEQMGINDSANVQCGRYSGGMKRRLSAAMAMVGNPPVALLDEPTAGVDPVSRRQFWELVRAIRDAGQSLILTSHSMEECEALCSRLCIMVNGEIQCIGSIQHLRNKFTQGFTVSLKLNIESENMAELNDKLDELAKKMKEKFGSFTLKEQHLSVVEYQVSDMDIPWESIFEYMEQIRSEYDTYILDYAVTEPTLEEVFLGFAKAKYSDRLANVSLLTQLVSCQICK